MPVGRRPFCSPFIGAKRITKEAARKKKPQGRSEPCENLPSPTRVKMEGMIRHVVCVWVRGYRKKQEIEAFSLILQMMLVRLGTLASSSASPQAFTANLSHPLLTN